MTGISLWWKVWHTVGQEPTAQGTSRPQLAAPRLALLGIKMEFLEEFGFEMLQPDELMRWWATLETAATWW